MEKINNISFFEEVEVIQKGKRTFPSLRAPFRTISQNHTSFAILIAVEQINTAIKTLFYLHVFDPSGEIFYIFGLNGYRTSQAEQFIICDVNNIIFEMTGEYKVAVTANVNDQSIPLGESNFYVEAQMDSENE
ncbi:hypothetical protein NYE27_21075 [Paenibacillus sp. FSL R10-2779]|uniref:hypothetical protein n=1 Tax=Paenibacillus sp. FSL R10-2779 TaxID=2975340 RepID=UPI0030F7EA3B